MDQDCSTWKCNMCGFVGMEDGSDGYYYCIRCGCQAENIIDTGVADEDLFDKGGDQSHAVYSNRYRRPSQPQSLTPAQTHSEYTPQTQKLWSQLTQGSHEKCGDHQVSVKEEAFSDGFGPTDPSDFGSSEAEKRVGYTYEDYYKELRRIYVLGLQMIIQAQCEALVEKFNVNPLICGIVGPIWLRYLARTGVFHDDWADETIRQSEFQIRGEPEDSKPHDKYKSEPHNIHGQRALMIWYKCLRKKIPLSCSLAVSFLGCYVAREAILPTDIVKWSVEGKLTYFNSSVEVEKIFGQSLLGFPLSIKYMFTPSRAVPPQNLELFAALIAESIGLNLPPVNFYAIATRYLKELALPVEKILPSACRLHEWMMPPDLWLSTNEYRFPTRVCVMSILIVTIRILYNINGLGAWERSLSSNDFSSKSKQVGTVDSIDSPNVRDKAGTGSDSLNAETELDAAEILWNLQARYSDINTAYEYSKDLPTFLQFCKNVVFAGSEPPLEFYHEEKGLIDQFWDFYENEGIKSETTKETNEDSEPLEDVGEQYKITRNKGKSRHNKRSSYDDGYSSHNSKEAANPEPSDEASAESLKERAIREMKADMEENRFCYIPPRVKIKSVDYIHYERKKDEGFLTYVAHADYYILLRACARVAKVEIRVMHLGVLSLERRLGWMEKRIDHCLQLSPPDITCESCTVPP